MHEGRQQGLHLLPSLIPRRVVSQALALCSSACSQTFALRKALGLQTQS
jgi:hypothetical protein